MLKKYCIIIAGPTATGKTSLAIQLALHFQTEIISADSRQCFKELNIAVAKPSIRQLQEMRHYFINSHSIQEEVNAGLFEDYALEKVDTIFKEHKIAFMVGGTGLYIKAFCEGVDKIPKASKEIRQEIESAYKRHGLVWLQQEVKNHDPAFYAVGEIQNPQRLVRALETWKATGNSVLSYRKGKKEPRHFNIIKIGVTLPKEQLHHNINHRVDEMIKAGLVDEVKILWPYKNFNALQTVGYSEIFDHLEGKISLGKAMDLIKQNTRQYAKRQMTWFRKDKEIIWFDPTQVEDIIQYIDEKTKE